MPKNALLTSTGQETISFLLAELDKLESQYPDANTPGSSFYAQKTHMAIKALLKMLLDAADIRKFFQLTIFNPKPKPSLFAENIKDQFRNLINDQGVYFSVENTHLKNMASLITEAFKGDIDAFFDLSGETVLKRLNITSVYIASKIKAYIKVLEISCKIFEDSALDKKIFLANSESNSNGWMLAQYKINSPEPDENANVTEMSSVWNDFLITEGEWVNEYSNNTSKSKSKQQRIESIWQVIAAPHSEDFLHFQVALDKAYSELREILSEPKDEFFGESEEAIAGWILSLHDLILTSRGLIASVSDDDGDSIYMDARSRLSSISDYMDARSRLSSISEHDTENAEYASISSRKKSTGDFSSFKSWSYNSSSSTRRNSILEQKESSSSSTAFSRKPVLSLNDKVIVFEAMFESAISLYNEKSPDTKIPQKDVTLNGVKLALHSRNTIVANFRRRIENLANNIKNPEEIAQELANLIENLGPIYTTEMFSSFRSKNFLAHLHALHTVLPFLINSENYTLKKELLELVEELVKQYNLVRERHFSSERLMLNKERDVLSLNSKKDPRNAILQNMLYEILQPNCKLTNILKENVDRIDQLQEAHKSRFPGVGKIVQSDLVECIKKFNLGLVLLEVMQNKIEQLKSVDVKNNIGSSNATNHHDDGSRKGLRLDPFSL